MSNSSLCAKIFWKIENLIYCRYSHFESDRFVVNCLDKSSWYLDYYSASGEICLNRANDDKVEQNFTVEVKIDVLDANNEPQCGKLTPFRSYSLGSSSQALEIPLKTVCDNAKKYLKGTIFTIRCRMWTEKKYPSHILTLAALLTRMPRRDCTIYQHIDKPLNAKKIDQGRSSSEKTIKNLITNARNTLLKNTLGMYRDGSMSDFSIQVNNRKFPVHTFILASCSPVFHRMLQTNMKEKNDKILKLDELDEDTVHQMLEYMYSGDPGKLTIDSAIKLYCVGDQYQMLDLKEITVLYLKLNITPLSACDIFHLADQHGDEDLKSFVTAFIGFHEKEIILSKDFETLLESNHMLCLNIYRELSKLRLE